MPSPRIYWYDVGAATGLNGSIQRANLDGSGVEVLVTGAESNVCSPPLTLDLAAEKIYWSESGAGKIRQATLDGTGVEDFLTDADVPLVLDDACGLAVDSAGGKIYWTHQNDTAGRPGTVHRANLDGTGVEELFTGLAGVGGIALDVDAEKVKVVGTVDAPPSSWNWSDAGLPMALGDQVQWKAKGPAN